MDYQNPGPSREEIDKLEGMTVLQFGTEFCAFCQMAEPLIQGALNRRDGLRVFKVEDGPGRKLGRSFRIKLWPTLVFLKNGVEVGRVVRPESEEQIDEELKKLI